MYSLVATGQLSARHLAIEGKLILCEHIQKCLRRTEMDRTRAEIS